MAIFDPVDSKFYCECGCGTQIPFYTRCARGHHMRMPEVHERIVEWARKYGRYPNTPESNEKRRKALQRNWDLISLEEADKRLRSSFHSEAAREAAVETLRSPEVRAKIGDISKRIWAAYSPEEKKERLEDSFLSKAAKRASAETRGTPECRARMGRIFRENWAKLNLEEQKERMETFRSGVSVVPNKCEEVLWKFLGQAFPGVFTPDWLERIDIGGRYPDFYTRNGYKLVIESNGNYWHSPEYFDRPTEEDQIAHYKKYGWTCMVVWANSADDIIYEWPGLARKIQGSLGMSEREF